MKQITKCLMVLVSGLALAIALAACSGPGKTGDGIMTLYVGPALVECTGFIPQMCMQVKQDPEGEYEFLYDQIEGFTYEEGFEYELRVRVEQIENPPADGSSLKYTLVEEVSKTASSGG